MSKSNRENWKQWSVREKSKIFLQKQKHGHWHGSETNLLLIYDN